MNIVHRLRETRAERLKRIYPYNSDFYDFDWPFMKIDADILTESAKACKGKPEEGKRSMCRSLAISLGTKEEELEETIDELMLEPQGELFAMLGHVMKSSKLPDVMEAFKEKMIRELGK